MEACLTNRSAPSALLTLARGLAITANALRATAHALDVWLASREKARQDRAILAAMSDRELADIGLSRGYLADVVAETWKREAMR